MQRRSEYPRRVAVAAAGVLAVAAIVALSSRGEGSAPASLVTWSSFFSSEPQPDTEHRQKQLVQPVLVQQALPVKPPPSTEDAMEQIREMIARATDTPLGDLSSSSRPQSSLHNKAAKAPQTSESAKWREALTGEGAHDAKKDSLSTIVNAIFHPPSRPTRLPQSVLRGKYTPMTKAPNGTRPAEALTAQGMQAIIDSSTRKAERWLHEMWPSSNQPHAPVAATTGTASKRPVRSKKDESEAGKESSAKKTAVSASTGQPNSTDGAAARLAAAIRAEHLAEKHLAHMQAQVKLDHREFVTTLGMVKTADKARDAARRRAKLMKEERREKKEATEADIVGKQAQEQVGRQAQEVSLQNKALRRQERREDHKIARLSASAKASAQKLPGTHMSARAVGWLASVPQVGAAASRRPAAGSARARGRGGAVRPLKAGDPGWADTVKRDMEFELRRETESEEAEVEAEKKKVLLERAQLEHEKRAATTKIDKLQGEAASARQEEEQDFTKMRQLQQDLQEEKARQRKQAAADSLREQHDKAAAMSKQLRDEALLARDEARREARAHVISSDESSGEITPAPRGETVSRATGGGGGGGGGGASASAARFTVPAPRQAASSPAAAREAQEISRLSGIMAKIAHDEKEEQQLESRKLLPLIQSPTTSRSRRAAPPSPALPAPQQRLLHPKLHRTQASVGEATTASSFADVSDFASVPSSLSTLPPQSSGPTSIADGGKIHLLGWTVEGGKEVPLYAGPPAKLAHAQAATGALAGAGGSQVPLLGWTSDGGKRIPVYATFQSASPGSAESGAPGSAALHEVAALYASPAAT